MVASSSAYCSTMLPTSVNSPRLRSSPAAMLTRIPLAPRRSISSSSGLRMAASAASSARLSPRATALPIIAMPISDITVRTSAKSTLIMPGRVIRSAIPCTAPLSTSLAALNALTRLQFLPSTCISFSFGIIIRESTASRSSLMPSSAIFIRLRPSNGNGRVTTATVRIPSSRATSATMGAAPVPVPPPMPAVMNTISAPASVSAILSRSSIAAWRPISGLAPAPSPLVSSPPICSAVRAALRLSA